MRTLLFMLVSLSPAFADVNTAIEKGKSYLLSHNVLDTSDHGIGPPCLAGLALLECDVKTDAAIIQSLRTLVRSRAVTETSTYQTALAILFLDRVGNPADVACIQVLGARLLAGQGITGGWGYATFDAVDNVSAVANSMGSPATASKLCGEAVRIINGVARGGRANAALAGDDNSNTQFATIGLWVAKRNGVPTDTAFRRLQSRFLRSQSPTDGGWAYGIDSRNSAPSMTCAGLLALAAAKAAGESELVTIPEGGKKEGDDPFEKPPRPGQATDDDNPNPAPTTPVDPLDVQLRDRAIERGLKTLGKLLENSGSNPSAGSGFGGVDDLYFFWSLERVGVAFGLETIGGVNWYDWGSRGIIAAQKDDGSWPGSYNPTVNTSFALLFLKKANFTADLTRKIAGKVRDPGSGELRGGRGITISGAGTPQPKKGAVDPKAPDLGKVRKTAEADALAAALAQADDRTWPVKLKQSRDGLGPHHTLALVKVIALLEDRRLYHAREALAERLTRMTSETLGRMLADRDAELRRAACLAVAMKDERSLVPAVIENLLDANDVVSRAAKASLKALSNDDYGPPVGGGDEEKRLAAEAWRLWYEKDKRR